MPKRDKSKKKAERVMLGLRVTPELKQRLDAAAAQSGRSQSQEAEFRLEHSFNREQLLVDVLGLAYGPQAAGILMLLGLTMGQAAYAILDRGGDARHANWFREWPDDPEARHVGVLAGIMLLAALRPAGSVSESVAKGPKGWKRAFTIITEAQSALADNANRFPFDGSSAWSDARIIRALLGPSLTTNFDLYSDIAERLKEDRPAKAETTKRAFYTFIEDLRDAIGDESRSPSHE